MKLFVLSTWICLLSACAGGISGSGSSELYGEVKGGLETSRTTISR